MSRYRTHLGYGHVADVEADNFTRILSGQFLDDEEVRFDRPNTYDGTFEYVGVAVAGSNTFDPVWSCARCTWINNRQTRYQFATNMSWDSRTTRQWN